MAFIETTLLSTREPAVGSRILGQVVAVPTGRLDKVSLYIEPKISNAAIAANIEIRAEVYVVDSFRLPIGIPIATDSIVLSDIKSRGFRNFRLETDAPSTVAIVLKAIGGTLDDYVAWRYVSTSSVGEELLISENDGTTWTQDTSRKFAYIAYSIIPDAVDMDDQSAEVQPGEALSHVDDTEAEFELSELTRAAVVGDTVVIDFGDFVATLVVDQSGSMTWNDHDGLRFEFLKEYAEDIDSNLPESSEVTFSLVKFRSRQVGSLDIILQTEEGGGFIDGVRIVRKIGSRPTSPSDGLVIFEGFATQIVDSGLSAGALYYYGIYTYDAEGNFSEERFDYGIPQSPPALPLGVAALMLAEKITLSGDFDIGYRQIEVSWVNPEGFLYDQVTITRRTDRYADSPDDGTSFVFDPRVTTSFTDFTIANPAVIGMTYYYSIFTHDSVSGLKVRGSNARRQSITISEVDRVWEKAEPPGNVPPPGFDSTPPAAPTNFTATAGDRRILLNWQASDADTRRFRLYFGENEYPKRETQDNGEAGYSGILLLDGEGTSFIHNGLENGQPYFYTVVSFDQVGNQSVTGTNVTGRPDPESTADIPPSAADDFFVEVLGGSSNQLTWKLDVNRTNQVEAYFGDNVRVVTELSFQDGDPRRTSATLEFVEDERSVKVYDSSGQPVDDTNNNVDEDTVLIFDQAPVTSTNSLSADVFMTPFLNLLNPLASTTLRFHSSLNVKKRSTNSLITEIVSRNAEILFKNPFDISIENDPPQTVAVRTFNPRCNLDGSPEYEISYVDGVLARSGESYSAVVVATYRGAALASNIDLTVRILDADSGEPSDRFSLPGKDSDGASIFSTTTEEDEILDRTGEPTGEIEEKTTIRLTLPPQDLPGKFIMEVTGTYLGYTRTVTSEISYASSLNIDVKTSSFTADGVDIAEQEAFVYVGGINFDEADKVPVADLTVVNWELTKIAGGGPLTRSFFSRDTVPGSGVLSYTRGGIAKNVFFGPGTDIESSSNPNTCTDGELYQLKVTTNALGMTAEGYGTIELLPFEPTDLKRVFLRLAKTQKDEFGNSYETSNLAKISIFADGSQQAFFELVAKPETDTETDIRSGQEFRSKVVAAGGTVPSLEDGTVVNVVVKQFSVEGNPLNVLIKTDLSPDGSSGRAKATVIGGKASFSVSANLRATGEIMDVPLTSEISNPFYGENVLWEPSPIVFSVSVFAQLEINGNPAIYAGGGSDINADVPPAFVSFKEPLQIITGIS